MHTASDWLMHRHWELRDAGYYLYLIDLNPIFGNRPPIVAITKPVGIDLIIEREMMRHRVKAAEEILAEAVDPIYKSIVRHRNRRDYGRRNP